MTTSPDSLVPGNTAQGFTLLFVDDEANILSSLRRLFRPHGYRILTADGGEAALAVLETESVDLVVSDMRMPGMSGAALLATIRQRWPDVTRILLTGYADMQSMIEAINVAGISRYIAKPWEDQDILRIVEDALTIKLLSREKARLDQQVREQNEALTMLNASLEDKVRERTLALEKAMSDVKLAHERLKKGFVTSVKMFSALIDMRSGTLAGQSRNVANHALLIARQLMLPESEVHDIFIAGLLHSIGKIAFPDTLLAKPISLMSTAELETYKQYPVNSQAALMASEQLQVPAQLIRNQHERMDGLGVPDRLKGDQIAIGSRILGVAADFQALQAGIVTGQRMDARAALKQLEASRESRYDGAVLDALQAVLAAQPSEVVERELYSRDLVPGMTLAHDLIVNGVMLLARDYVLDDRLIRLIRHFEEGAGSKLNIFVRA